MGLALYFYFSIGSIPPRGVSSQPLSAVFGSKKRLKRCNVSVSGFVLPCSKRSIVAFDTYKLVPLVCSAILAAFKPVTTLINLNCSTVRIDIPIIIRTIACKASSNDCKTLTIVLSCTQLLAFYAGIKKAARCIRPAACHSQNLKESTMNSVKYSAFSVCFKHLTKDFLSASGIRSLAAQVLGGAA